MRTRSGWRLPRRGGITMDGLKDKPLTAFCLGVLLPSIIGVIVICNLVAWRVYWPRERGSMRMFRTYTQNTCVIGTVLFKLGIVGGLVSWFLLANIERTEFMVQISLHISIAVAVAGLIVHFIGVF
jgi:hypothetical protein